MFLLLVILITLYVLLPQEAEGLSSLVPEMESRGVRLHALVHETLGAEEFKAFIKGDVYLDPQVSWHISEL